MDLGIFIPIGNNGWMMSTTSPQYMPSFTLNRAIATQAEAYGFNFLLSMVKLRGFGGPTEFWDHNLESFTLMAGLAAVTEHIQLFASVALPTLPPALVARMAATIDDISTGRFGINIVSGWNKPEYAQMGLWPGDWYYERRYDYASEYVTILRELWATGRSDFQGEFFRMDDCRLSPRPRRGCVPIVCAGQSNRGMQFCAAHGDYQFIFGHDDFTAMAADTRRLLDAAAQTGRNVGAYALYFVITGETDAVAAHKWASYREGADLEAIAFMTGQTHPDASGSAAEIATQMQNAFALNIGKVVGSHATVARQLDVLASIDGLTGVMCIFDDFVLGIEDFGRNVMPLLHCR
ncbi:MAG TPA: pyrimidine utilization protein A [Candidatus Tectomicrobia bacterium]